ncbi:MAG: hypothetical protein D6758_01615, partial [Gammaproteobacteria bacterium]
MLLAHDGNQITHVWSQADGWPTGGALSDLLPDGAPAKLKARWRAALREACPIQLITPDASGDLHVIRFWPARDSQPGWVSITPANTQQARRYTVWQTHQRPPHPLKLRGAVTRTLLVFAPALLAQFLFNTLPENWQWAGALTVSLIMAAGVARY